MTKPQSTLAQSLPRSGIREVMDLARQMDDVIVLVVGEPSFNTADHIIDAAAKAAHEGTTKYTPNAGLPGLRAAVAERYSRKWGRPVSPGEVLVTAGAVNALAAIVAGIAEEGDEILVPDPGWPNYMAMIGLARAVPVRYAMKPENGYLPDPTDLELAHHATHEGHHHQQPVKPHRRRLSAGDRAGTGRARGQT